MTLKRLLNFLLTKTSPLKRSEIYNWAKDQPDFVSKTKTKKLLRTLQKQRAVKTYPSDGLKNPFIFRLSSRLTNPIKQPTQTPPTQTTINQTT